MRRSAKYPCSVSKGKIRLQAFQESECEVYRFTFNRSTQKKDLMRCRSCPRNGKEAETEVCVVYEAT